MYYLLFPVTKKQLYCVLRDERSDLLITCFKIIIPDIVDDSLVLTEDLC